MRLPRLVQWDAVRVEWMDSTGADGGWHTLEERERNVTGCVTVGMVESQTAQRITLVLSRESNHGHIDGSVTIPAAAVTGIQVLKVAKK